MIFSIFSTRVPPYQPCIMSHSGRPAGARTGHPVVPGPGHPESTRPGGHPVFRCFYVSTSTQEATSVLFCVGLKNICNELNKYDENWRKLPRDLQKSHEPRWSLWYFCVEKHHAKLDFFRKSHPTRWDFEIPRIRSHTWGNL